MIKLCKTAWVAFVCLDLFRPINYKPRLPVEMNDELSIDLSADIGWQYMGCR